ncbi:DUF2512 family protein [Metabacillus herbersteinensis]|uniref:DUF2512 family protein n=1 Tax=Metabacillus herbersteinensis TaxID=283816 RepID=A0ABV6GLJ1_9BACI
MRIFTALGAKFLLTFAILSFVLGLIFQVNFGYVFVVSVALTFISYLIGDLFILPKTNNTIASIADFGLAFAGISFLLALVNENPNFPIVTAAFFASVGLAVAEFLFHRLITLNNKVEGKSDDRRNTALLKENYAMEAAEEFDYKSKEKR